MMLPPSVISGAAPRLTAISEYTLTSIATRNPSRLVLTNSPFRSAAGANATACTRMSSLPYFSLRAANRVSIS